MFSAPIRRGIFVVAAVCVASLVFTAGQANAGFGRPSLTPLVLGPADYLAPKYFTVNLRDGATHRDADLVAGYFRSYGLKVTVDYVDGLLFAQGTHAQAAAAAHVAYDRVMRAGQEFVISDRPESYPLAVSSRIAATTINDGGIAYDGGISGNVVIKRDDIGVADADGYTPTDIQTYYNFGSIESTGSEGSGQGIATVECAAISTADLSAFESRYGLPATAVTQVSVDGGTTSATFEATTQIERIIGTAYKASITVYEVPTACTFSDIADAVAKILSDDATKKYHAVAITYGQFEDVYSADGATSDMTAEDTDFAKLAADKTMTFAVTADNAAFSSLEGFDLGVFYPGSDPNVVAVGRTVADSVSASNPTRLFEGGSYDSGGGASKVYAIPPWQKGVAGMVSTTMRNVPDVALDGDCGTLYAGNFDGDLYVVCGSIYAADTWTGLFALVDAGRKTAGKTALASLPETLYTERTVSGFYTDITVGCNGFYCSATGWDPVTGLGVPSASKVYSTLVGLP
jgi:subtilase family serine protease